MSQQHLHEKCFIYPLVKSLNPLVHNIKFNYSTEELIMKKLLLNLLAVMSKDSAALQVSQTFQVFVIIKINVV